MDVAVFHGVIWDYICEVLLHPGGVIVMLHEVHITFDNMVPFKGKKEGDLFFICILQ